MKSTDATIKDIQLFFIPVQTRVPLKFGTETLQTVTCARAKMTIEDRTGKRAVGWGETPLSVQWVWPSELTYGTRHNALIEFTKVLRQSLATAGLTGHPIEMAHEFIENHLHPIQDQFNQNLGLADSMPYLAGLVVMSVFDQALHDAFGNLHERDIYATYNDQFMNRDLSSLIEADSDSRCSLEGMYPDSFLVENAPQRLPVWHLVGGLDPLTEQELKGEGPNDGYPVTLEQWIERDGLYCLKIKLRGNDPQWDYGRLREIGRISTQHDVKWLTADFNCTVREPAYVNEILDRLEQEDRETWEKILYVEQPFPYDLEEYSIDVSSVSARKPLFLDESAHDWKFVRLGRSLGWSGVALKTCKTQTGALLSLCWAKAHDMPLMVQDLTNPMLAQIPHVRLAAHAGTIMGVESNGMQFYPEASLPEQQIHPGLYQRRGGHLDLSTLGGTGFGYRIHEIDRDLSLFAVD